MGYFVDGSGMETRAVHVIPGGGHYGKKITVVIPESYKKGEGIDLVRYLSDKGAVTLLKIEGPGAIKNCEIGYTFSFNGEERLEITDIK